LYSLVYLQQQPEEAFKETASSKQNQVSIIQASSWQHPASRSNSIQQVAPSKQHPASSIQQAAPS